MIEAVIFDVDGTLVDTVDMHAEAWQRAFKEFGKELGFAEIVRRTRPARNGRRRVALERNFNQTLLSLLKREKL